MVSWHVVELASTAELVATIEIDPKAHAIVQARGLGNQVVSRKARQLILLWARRENLCWRA